MLIESEVDVGKIIPAAEKNVTTYANSPKKIDPKTRKKENYVGRLEIPPENRSIKCGQGFFHGGIFIVVTTIDFTRDIIVFVLTT